MNRLATESSPYLRQHANNPVDWYAWGPEAFEAAKTQNKPILLSVGYSSCHWCHVMAHESFEDEATAQVMNELYINIKVDREERPDIDALYMEATQAISGQGGWPMTVFLTHDGKPFFAGTYYPKEAYANLPGFTDLLRAVHSAWEGDRDEVERQASELTTAIEARTSASATSTELEREWLDHAYMTLEAAYDKEWGGFGGAPKFPQASMLELLFRSERQDHLQMIVNTLDAMASGGIYDHLGGGFCRYSVDAFWMVPHFEKMLYDQAALLSVYVAAFAKTGEQHYAQVATETVEYVARDLGAPRGGWYSSQDADTEGEEGKFYVWRPEEIESAIGNPEASTEFKEWFGVTKAGNFEGSNILHRPVRGDLIRSEVVENARQQLLNARNQRVRPGTDDKVLTEWNAMFITSLAAAAKTLKRDDWKATAEQAAQFLVDELRVDGRWMRSWQADTGARHLAYANDYAWLIEAFLALDQTDQAKQVADEMIRLFWDREHGGLFTTGNDAEKLVVRTKDLYDGANTSANSTAAVALAKLASATGDASWNEYSKQIVLLVSGPVAHHPTAFTNMLIALGLLID